MSDNETFDAIIIGGGAAGAAAALALARTGREVALIDRNRPAGRPDDAGLDPRVVAVSPGSQRLLEALDAWPRVRRDRIAGYHDMHVLAGRGEVTFRATEHGLDALGWIAELPELDSALWQGLENHRRVSLFAPAEVEAIGIGAEDVELSLAGGRTLTGRILLGADGAKSRVRAAAGIEATEHHYNQRAIVTHLDTGQANPGTAWQRFTDLGPLALLPLADGRSSLVWSVHDNEAEQLMGMGEAEFLGALANHCVEPPFGAFTAAGERHALPLVRRQSHPLAAGRVALIGDAARSVHPLAGQGLNLGLADAAVLIEVLDGWDRRGDPAERLARYARRRYSDSLLVAGGIHAINETRSLGGLGKHALGAGFAAMRLSRTARDVFVRRAAGLDEVRGAIGNLGD